MKAEISAWTVVQGKVEVVRSLKSKVEVDDELMVSLLEDVCLDYGVFELFLKDKIFLFKGFEGIQLVVCDESCQKYFSKGS